MKLTKRVIDAARYEGEGQSRDVRWDDVLSGFGLRIYPTGRKAFVLNYRVNGRKRLLTIGTYGTLTLEQARKQARKHLVATTEGSDPLEARRKAASGETMEMLCEAYLERYARPRKKSARDDERRIERVVLPAWERMKAAHIRSADVAALHSRIGKEAPYEANRLAALLSKMFALARRWGFVPEDHINPARDIEHFKEKKRDRWVTPEELPRLTQEIDRLPNPHARAALWLYLLTGARKSELLTARWEHLDLARKELRFPDTKADRVHYLPLSEPALAILRDLPRIDGNPYLFPGARAGGHLVNIDKPWQKARREAGVADVRLHDLRRTVGSWLAQAGNSLHLIGRVLNHSNQATTAIYARFGQDHVRAALEAHGSKLMRIAGKRPPGQVIDIQQAKRAKQASGS